MTNDDAITDIKEIFSKCKATIDANNLEIKELFQKEIKELKTEFDNKISSILQDTKILNEKSEKHDKSIILITDTLPLIDTRKSISQIASALYTIENQLVATNEQIAYNCSKELKQLYSHISSFNSVAKSNEKEISMIKQITNSRFHFFENEISNIYNKIGEYVQSIKFEPFKDSITQQVGEIKSALSSIEAGITKKVLASSLNYITAKQSSPRIEKSINELNERMASLTVQKDSIESTEPKLDLISLSSSINKLGFSKADKAEMMHTLNNYAGKEDLEDIKYKYCIIQKQLAELAIVVEDLLKGTNRNADEFLKTRKRTTLINTTYSISKKLKNLSRVDARSKNISVDVLNLSLPRFNK
jgi:hypothetical protein